MALSTQPLLDYIYVRKPAVQKSGSLYINAPIDPAAPRIAEVISVGPGRPSEYTGALLPMPDIKAGDSVLMHGNQGLAVRQEGDDVYAIKPSDLIGKA